MKKFKLGTSFLFLILFCVVAGNIVLLINYISALILHELAHVYISIKHGYTLKYFKLNMFGVSVELDENIHNQDVFVINIAGPMFNLLICVLCLALFFLVPKTYSVLSSFCVSNLILAVFNLLPIYPLDGGKIFYALVNNKKVYKRLDLIFRALLVILFLTLFILSGFVTFNWFYLLMALFFAFSHERKIPTFSIFKQRKYKKIEKVNVLNVNENLQIVQLLKIIKPNRYTIFYCSKTKLYLDEDKLIEYATKFPLTKPIRELE